jgi:xanthine dehydrogenase molybdenum-binding subunit
MDHGGGTLEAIAKLVGEALCVPFDLVNVAEVGTTTTVYDCVTHATRGVYAGGGAAVKAANTVRKDILETAAKFMNMYADALELKLDPELGQGVVYAPSIPDRKMSLKDIATRCWSESWKTIAAVESYRPTSCPPAYVAVFLEVEVDTWTGAVRTVNAALGADCGTVVNPAMARGQLEGGLSKGVGYALIEGCAWCDDGQLTSRGFPMDAKIAAFDESPRVENLQAYFVETYEPTGPFGAKGIGEAAMNPVAAAYANAIANAIGVRFTRLPILPEVIVAALEKTGKGGSR